MEKCQQLRQVLEKMGLAPVGDGEIAHYLTEAGLTEPHATNFVSDFGSGTYHVEEIPWAPSWAVQVVKEALNSGQEPSVVLQEYYKAVRELPPEQVAKSRLAELN